MKAPAFLTIDQVLAIHHRVIKEFGGNPRVRDRGLLESAVLLPSAQYDGEYLHPDLPSMAAAYLFHICKNHPFADGNKRTALATAEVFLLVNGWRLKATNDEVAELTLAVAAAEIGKDAVIEFFRKNAGRV